MSNAGPEAHDLGPEFDDSSLLPYSELCINKGWDPVPPDSGAAALKVNCQDDAILIRHFGGNERWAFAGVFDGHGQGLKFFEIPSGGRSKPKRTIDPPSGAPRNRIWLQI